MSRWQTTATMMIAGLLAMSACDEPAPKPPPQIAKKPAKKAPTPAKVEAKPKPKFEVPRLLFVLPSVKALAAKDGDGTLQQSITAVAGKFSKRLGDYYDFGLVQTGHDSVDSCSSVRTTTAAGFKIRTDSAAALAATRPMGDKVALASAFEAIAAKGFAEQVSTMIVVVTSGPDACGKDACAAVRALEKSAKDLQVHVVAYGAGKDATESLACLTSGGGEVSLAKDRAELEGFIELALGEGLCPPMAMPCWEQSLRSPLPAVRQMVVDHCCDLKSPVAFRCPYKAMRDAELDIRKKAFGCILDKSYSREEEALLLALHDDDLGMRTRVLDRLEEKGLHKRLKKVMLKSVIDPDPALRGRAITLVGKTIEPWTKVILYEVLADEDVSARVAMVEALANRYDQVAFDALTKAAADADGEVRGAAVKVLAATGDPRALPALQTLLKDRAKIPGGGTVGVAAKAAIAAQKGGASK